MRSWKGLPAFLSAAMMASPSAVAGTLSDRLQKICAYKENVEYKGRSAKCVASYDSGLRAASASYQPAIVGPNTASRDVVNRTMYGSKDVYKNEFPGVEGTKEWIDDEYNFGAYDPTVDNKIAASAARGGGNSCSQHLPKVTVAKPKLVNGDRIERGYPLAFRFLSVVDKRFNNGNAGKRDNGETVSAPDVPLYAWLEKKWLPTQHADPAATSESDGSCFMWAPWSVDRKVLKSLQGIQSGLMCEGIPLTRGEIKEIYFQLYAAVAKKRPFLREKTPAFFSGDEKQESFLENTLVSKAMDANLGLARLGALGGPLEDGNHAALEPDTVLEKFRAAMEAGKSFTFDRDHGAQMWNQPAVAMAVTRYRGDTPAADLLSTTDYAPVGGDAGLAELQRLERALIVRLSAGQGLDAGDRRQLESMAGGTLAADASLEAQARLVSDAKAKLLAAGKIAPKKGSGTLSVIHQDLTVVYGEENQYASMAEDREATRSFRFATVVDGAGNKVKAAWNPSQGTLGELCKGEKPEFTGFSSWNAKYECCKLETGQIKQDYRVFTSAVPPRHVDIFDPIEPDLSTPEGEAYLQFQAMLMGESAFTDPAQKAEAIRRWGPLKAACPSFDSAARFTRLFDQCRGKGAVSDAERNELTELVSKADFLDDQWVAGFCKTTGVTGFAELKSALLAKRPDLCK